MGKKFLPIARDWRKAFVRNGLQNLESGRIVFAPIDGKGVLAGAFI